MNKYVYIIVNLDKPGKYFYNNLNSSFLYEPVYVGAGSGPRIHISIEITKKYRGYKNIIAFKLFENLSKEESCDIEKLFIKEIGRKDLNLGPLSNETDGGIGPLNHIKSIELRKLISEQKKLRIGNLNPFYGKTHSEETKKKLSEYWKSGNIEEHIKHLKENHADFNGENNPCYGKRLYNNGIINRYLNENEIELYPGFIKGGLKRNRRQVKKES